MMHMYCELTGKLKQLGAEFNDIFGTSRYSYQMCRKQMLTLKEVMEAMQNMLGLSNLRVFVTEGRDNHFSVVTCTLQEMIDDMLSQVIEESCIDSMIYEIVEG